jgi:hypothetical protein
MRVLFGLLLCVLFGPLLPAAEFRGRVLDAERGEPIPARVSLQHESGEWLFVESADPEGSALPYKEQWVPMPDSVERHTTVSAHPFKIELPAGNYSLTIERGKEYIPLRAELTIGDKPVDQTYRLKRWINLAASGWYSGETHVHRRIVELPNVMQAEDLNVAFPVTFWTVSGAKAPDREPSPLRRQGPSPFGPRVDRGTEPIYVDASHVIVPRNTEYEIFSLGEDRHVLGAIFLLNHQSVFTATAPPIAGIAKQAHEEGALLDLDKHSWPWSMMLVPVANVDLFELSNNSVWRTKFGFNRSQVPPAEWMEIEYESPGVFTEWGWLNFGWEVYYALVNCGFDLAPTAGTASGVHPVPLGYSRVYVQTGKQFNLSDWLSGLRDGRSFVTTGPMLFATVNGQHPGERFTFEKQAEQDFEIQIEALGEKPISAVEILVNGQVVELIVPKSDRTTSGAWRASFSSKVSLGDSGWIAVRSIEKQPDGRKRFAHTAPWYVSMANCPRTPRREQIDYFIGLMHAEIERNRPVLSPDALAEFEQALAIYERIRERTP